MLQIRKINERISVAPQIAAKDLQAIADAGFTSVMCNRPDGESLDQPPIAELEAAAKDAGLDFFHIPVSGGFPAASVAGFREVYEQSEGPVFAWCQSGTRCACLWALGEARHTDVARVLEATSAAGYDLSGLTPLLMDAATQTRS